MLITLLAMLESEEDRRTLSALYEENHDRMEQTALRILNDPRDAEDAVQNAFVKVIGSFEKIFEIPREEIPFWLVCIVKNEALSILRKNARSETMEDMDVFEYPTAPVPDYKTFVAYIRKLPENYRAIMEMKLLGYSDAETARHLGMTETGVSTRASRARKVLRKIVEEGGIGYDG